MTTGKKSDQSRAITPKQTSCRLVKALLIDKRYVFCKAITDHSIRVHSTRLTLVWVSEEHYCSIEQVLVTTHMEATRRSDVE